jgi:hypothetical protein
LFSRNPNRPQVGWNGNRLIDLSAISRLEPRHSLCRMSHPGFDPKRRARRGSLIEDVRKSSEKTKGEWRNRGGDSEQASHTVAL